MKKILLTFSFLGILSGNAFAQNSKPAKNTSTQQQTNAVKEDIKTSFTKKIADFKEQLKKDDKEGAMKVYMDLFDLMQKSMAKNNDAFTKSTKDDERALLQRKLTEQQTLYGEIKALLGDISQNKDALVNKLNDYLKTM